MKQRPLPSTGITRFQRYYGPLRHLDQPGPSLAGVPLKVTRLHRIEASRVASDFLCRHAGAYTPAESRNAFVARFFPDDGLPRFDIGSASAMDVSRLRWRSRLFRPVDSRGCLTQPFPSKALVDSSPPPRLRLLLAGATVARRAYFPLKIHAFSRRTSKNKPRRAQRYIYMCILSVAECQEPSAQKKTTTRHDAK